MDKSKFKEFLTQEYGNFGPLIMKKLKKAYMNLEGPIDFTHFCDCTDKLINRSHSYMYKLFYGSLDFNQDGRICEWDLFKSVESIIQTQNDDLI